MRIRSLSSPRASAARQKVLANSTHLYRLLLLAIVVFVCSLAMFSFRSKLRARTDMVILRQFNPVAEEKPQTPDFLYFAYASDLSASRLKSGGGPSARFVSLGFVRHRRFAYSQESRVWRGGVADLVPSEDENDVVWGVVYRLANSDLPGLDRQKGVGKDDPLYERVEVTVEREGGGAVLHHCVTYAMVAKRRAKAPVLPSSQYRDCILRGAREVNLPHDYISKLEKIKHNGSSYRRKGVVC